MRPFKDILPTVLLVAAVFAGVALAAHWTGWIVDENCARQGIHTGDHSKHLSATNPAVFLNELDGKVFLLKGPSRAETLLGKHVAIDGKSEGDAITVKSIMEVPEHKQGG